MELSLTTKYAIESLVLLARSGDEPTSVRAICEELGIPQKYLGRVMPRLGRAGLVHVGRGKSGGYTLARAPDTITLTEIVEAVQGLASFEQCMLGLDTCTNTHEQCSLHRHWGPIRKQILETMTRVTLATLAGRGTGSATAGLPVLADVPAENAPKRRRRLRSH